MSVFHESELSYDVVVCGGGLAGVCAAIAAAREGARVGLIHDRTVLGGNSSSEVRVTVHGAGQFHAYGRETGIISELLIEERAQNHAWIMENGWTNSVWDLVLLSAIYAEPTIDLHLNTKVVGAHVEGRRVTEVEALVLDSETRLRVSGEVFVDATGDGLVAASAGCESMFGTEGSDRWNEPHAPEESSTDTMGNSLHFKTEEVGRDVPWAPPAWAHELSDRSFFYDAGRVPGDPRGGFWWIELGTPNHTIRDNRYLRSELQRYMLGIWDFMKNRDPALQEATRTRALDWMGSVLGTRESRRIVGQVVVTEGDIQERRAWPDEVAYGGWFLDLHTPGGLIAEHSEANSASNYDPFTERAALGYVGPYGIPLSALIARDVDNLLLAGRDVSASHAALGSMRVMGTTALMGQAAGVAAARVVRTGRDAAEFEPHDVVWVQQRLLRHGVWLPNVRNEDHDDLARTATVTASSHQKVRGIGPDVMGHAESHDMIDLRLRDGFLARCDTRMAQLIAVDRSLRQVSLCLTNHGREPTIACLAIHPCDGIHDYTVYGDEHALASASVTVEPGARRWVSWDVDLNDPGPYVRLELGTNPDLEWHQARTCLIAHPAIYEVGLTRMRRLQHGVSLAFRVDPPQAVFAAANVLSGSTRPHDRTHLWRSDPEEVLPASLELAWSEAHEISRVELTFAGNLLREYHAYHPFFRDPQTARDYAIEAWTGDRWVTVATVENNYQRRRVHGLSPSVTAERLRLVVTATNGERSVGLYEIRVYGSGS